MAEFPTLKGSWPWPWIGSYCIPSCITRWPLPKHQISLKSKKLLVDGRTFETHFIRSTRRSRPKKHTNTRRKHTDGNGRQTDTTRHIKYASHTDWCYVMWTSVIPGVTSMEQRQRTWQKHITTCHGEHAHAFISGCCDNNKNKPHMHVWLTWQARVQRSCTMSYYTASPKVNHEIFNIFYSISRLQWNWHTAF